MKPYSVLYYTCIHNPNVIKINRFSVLYCTLHQILYFYSGHEKFKQIVAL